MIAGAKEYILYLSHMLITSAGTSIASRGMLNTLIEDGTTGNANITCGKTNANIIE